MDVLNTEHNQLKSQTMESDAGSFVIEVEGKGTVCLPGDSVYELAKYEGNNVQVTGLVSQDGISFFPISSELPPNEHMYVQQPLYINVPIEAQGNEFIMDEDAIAIPISDVVAKKDFQELNNYEIADITSGMDQFSEFDNKVPILELVNTPDLKGKLLPQSVIKKHPSTDFVCEVPTYNTFVVSTNETKTSVLSSKSVIQESGLKKTILTNTMKSEQVFEVNLENVNDSQLPVPNKRGRPKKEKDVDPPQGKGPFICEVCNVKVETWPQFKAHKATHIEESKPYSCKVCSRSFNVEKNLKLHLLLHNVGNLTCTECNKTFTRFASFKAHLPIHEEEENMFCSECGDEFTNSANLEEHLQKHRSEWKKVPPANDEPKKIMCCKACNRMFTNQAVFENHKKDHQRLRSQLLALAPKRKRKRFRSSLGTSHGNECSVCKKSFPKPSQLVRHVRIHTGEKPFKCNICSTAFSQKGSLQIHMSKHSGYKPHVCSCCSLSFSQRGNLISHVNKVHRIPKEGEEIYKCVKCPCSFKKLASLNCHITRFHMGDKSPEEADTKSKLEANETEVDNILNTVAELTNTFPEGKSDSDILQTAIRISGLPLNGKSAVEVSGKDDAKTNTVVPPNAESNGSFRIVTIADRADDGNIKHYTVRQRREGNVRWHQCNVCAKEFKKPSDLVRHFRIHTREKPFKCNQCFRTFSIKSTLKSHIRTHLSPKLQECNTCGKKMTTMRSLRIHQRSHFGVRPFTCNVCMKSFTTSGQLKTHQTTNAHKTKLETPDSSAGNSNNNYFFEEPFVIVGDGEFQQQLSRREKLISRSQNASSAERPFECDFCQLKFRKSSHLKQHKLQHTGEKPFSCFVCYKNFTTNGVLKMHLKTHLGQKDFACDRCTSKFSTKGSLKRHMQTFHSEDRRYMCPYCQKRFKTSVNCRKHIKIHRYDNSQQFCKFKVNEAQAEDSKILLDQSVNIEPSKDENSSKTESSEVPDQTSLVDSTGTITLSALNQEPLTQESIRELEQTLNQELFGSEQEPHYTAQMISTEENEKENDFMDPSLLVKPLILNVDESVREPSIVHAVFSQTEDLQTVSNMAEILPDTKDPKASYGDMNDSNDKENKEHSFTQDCEVCGKTLFNSEAYKIHMKSHGSKKELNCKICGWKTMSRTSFKRHCIVHGQAKKYSCSECPAKFRLEIQLKKHKKLHETCQEDVALKMGKRKKGPFREFSEAETELLAAQDAKNGASVSEKILIESAAEKLRMDEKKKVDDEEDKEPRLSLGNDCKYCKKSFKKPSDLVRHVRVHTGERPFQCAQCNKCFRVKSTLSSHLRTHYGVKPVTCHICHSMFAAKSSLKVHMRLHTGARPFECPVCGQRFRTSGHRKNHLLSHSKNKAKTWKKQQLQMLNKIAVALVVNMPEESELNKADEKTVENAELQQTFDSSEMSTMQNVGENEALLLQLNDQNNIVQLLSTEQSENGILPSAEVNPDQPMQFQIYTTDGQVYITHPNSDLIICSDESAENSNEKKSAAAAALESAKEEPLISEKPETISKAKNVCEFCQKVFSKKSLLERHLRIHTGERPFACDLCGKRFTQSNALKAHVKAHKGERAFSCPYCEFSCVQRGNLRVHMSRTHQFAFFLNEDKKKVKNSKNTSVMLTDSLMKAQKSPSSVVDQVMGELFPQVT